MRDARGRRRVDILCFLGFLLFAPPLVAHTPHDAASVLELSPDFKEDGTLFAWISYRNVYLIKSNDRGASYTVSQHGRSSVPVECLAYSPDFKHDGLLYLGTKEGLMISRDRGASWRSICKGVHVISVLAAGGRLQTHRVFMGTEAHGLMVSEDEGATWYRVALPRAWKRIGSLAGTVDVVYMVADASRIAKYTAADRKCVDVTGEVELSGELYENVYKQGKKQKIPQVITALALSPAYASDHTLYAATFGKGVFKSTDAAASWTSCNAGLTELYLQDIALSPDYHRDRTLAVCTRQGSVYLSEDAGKRWQRKSNGLERKSDQDPLHCRKLRFSPGYADDGMMFLSKFEGIYRTDDRGGFWRHMNSLSLRYARYAAFSPDYTHDRTLFLGTYDGGVYRSRDAGKSWTPCNTGLAMMNINGLVLSPDYARDQTLFVTGLRHLLESTDGGDHWAPEASLASFKNEKIATRSMSISPDFLHDGELLMTNPRGPRAKGKKISENTRVLRYRVKSQRVEPVKLADRELQVNDVAYIPEYGKKKILFAAAGGGVYRSDDGGASWRLSGLENIGVRELAVSPAFLRDGTVFAVTRDRTTRSHNGHLYRSVDGGGTWKRCEADLEHVEVEHVTLSPVYDRDHTVFATGYGDGILKSTDGGATWHRSGLSDNLVRSVALSPEYARDNTVAACAFDGLYLSRDGGATWASVWRTAMFDEKRLDYAYRDKDGNSLAGEESPPIRRACGWRIIGNQPEASSRNYVVSAVPGHRVEFLFVGDAVRYLATMDRQMGVARILLDGAFQEEVDLYSAHKMFQAEVFAADHLAQGEHLLVVEVTGKKHAASEGRMVSIDAFEVGW